MNTRKNIRLFCSIFALAAVTVSCNDEDTSISDGEQIVISLDRAQTRAPIDNVSEIAGENFGIVAWHIKPLPHTPVQYPIGAYGKVELLSGTSYGADLYNASNIVTTYYWPELSNPANHSLHFFAWYPYDGAGAPTILTKDATTQQVSMSFTVKPDITEQVDLMATTHTPGWKSPVNFHFEHALTRVRFSFNKASETEEYVINGITMKNIATKDTVTVSKAGEFTWGSYPEKSNLSWTPASALSITKLSSSNEYTSMGDSFLTIPMDVGSLVVEITINDEVHTIEFSEITQEGFTKTWEPGLYVDYKVTIAENAIVPASIQSSVLSWTGAGQSVDFDPQYFLKVEGDTVIPPAGGTIQLTVTTNYAPLPTHQFGNKGLLTPVITEGDDWLEIVTTNYSAECMECIITLEPKTDNTGTERTAVVKVQAGNMIKNITVTQ